MAGNAELIGTTADGRQLIRLACAIAADAFARGKDEGADENADGTAWLQIVPEGPLVVARDGRAFQVPNAASVAANSELPMLLDWEHDSERWDGSTRAAGWGLELEARAGTGLWMRTKPTPKGKADIDAQEYRYLSPVLVIDAETREVQQIVSVALTNRPALRMQEIGQFRAQFSRFGLVVEPQEQSSMDKQKRALLCAALNLAESASDDAILEAQRAQAALVAASAGTKDLFAAQSADLTAARAEATSAKAEVIELKAKLSAAEAQAAAATRASKIEAMFQENRTKITPAHEKSLRAMFEKNPSTFESFVEFQLPSMVELCADAPPSTDVNGKPAGSAAPASTGEKPSLLEKERIRLRAKGFTEERITAALSHLVDQKARRGAAPDEED